MAKPPNIFVPLDVNYLRDPAIRRSGPDAELLYLRGLAHAKGGLTDGLVSDFDLPVVGVGLKKLQERVNTLVREGLWEPVEGGWLIRGWCKWNQTNAQLTEEKRRKQAGAEMTNHQRYHVGEGGEFASSCRLCLDSLERPLERPQ